MISLVMQKIDTNQVNIRFETSILQSGLCDYSDAYIAIKGTINVTDPNNNVYDKKLA